MYSLAYHAHATVFKNNYHLYSVQRCRRFIVCPNYTVILNTSGHKQYSFKSIKKCKYFLFFKCHLWLIWLRNNLLSSGTWYKSPGDYNVKIVLGIRRDLNNNNISHYKSPQKYVFDNVIFFD